MENNNFNQIPYGNNNGMNNGMPQQAQTYSNYNPYGYQGQSMQYNQAYYNVKKPGNNQPLTAEEVKEMMARGDTFEWKITEEDKRKAICTHKDPVTGASTIHELPDGSFECDICHSKFRFFEGTAEDVRNSIEDIKNVIQSIKTIYYDAPKEFMAAYCQIIPFLDKLDTIWSSAYKNFSDYANYNNVAAPRNMYSYDPWAAFSNMTNNPYASPYTYQQPMYTQPQAQMYQQAPQQNMNYNSQVPPANFGPNMNGMIMGNNNPCTYNPTANMQQPQQNYNPQPQQNYNPQSQVSQGQPDQSQTVVQTKTMNV